MVADAPPPDCRQLLTVLGDRRPLPRGPSVGAGEAPRHLPDAGRCLHILDAQGLRPPGNTASVDQGVARVVEAANSLTEQDPLTGSELVEVCLSTRPGGTPRSGSRGAPDRGAVPLPAGCPELDPVGFLEAVKQHRAVGLREELSVHLDHGVSADRWWWARSFGAGAPRRAARWDTLPRGRPPAG